LRLLLYKLLTQAIIILGRLRSKLDLDLIVRVDRTFKDPPHLFSNVCCDCELTHRFTYSEGVRYQQPIRPKGYDYSWRKFAGKSSLFKSEDEWGDIPRGNVNGSAF